MNSTTYTKIGIGILSGAMELFFITFSYEKVVDMRLSLHSMVYSFPTTCNHADTLFFKMNFESKCRLLAHRSKMVQIKHKSVLTVSIFATPSLLLAAQCSANG